MQTIKFIFPQFLLLSMIVITQINCFENVVDLIGKDIVITYERQSFNYFMNTTRTTKADIEMNWRFRFEFTNASANNPELMKIRINRGYPLWVNQNSLLVYSTLESTLFTIKPVNNSTTGSVNIYKGEDPLVTPSSGPPFSFYLQSRYPTEPVANFQLSHFPIDLTELYSQNQANVTNIVDIIHDSSVVDKNVAYTQLLNLMRWYGHLPGKEIFYLGLHIWEDIGRGDLFSSLPFQVQLLISGGSGGFGNNYKLYYKGNNGTELIPMRGAVAVATDLPEDILPFTITHRTGRVGTWAITYGERGQLFVNYNLVQTMPLIESQAGDRRFGFQLHLGPDLQSVQIYSARYYEEYHPLVPAGSAPDVPFRGYWPVTDWNGANFFVDE